MEINKKEHDEFIKRFVMCLENKYMKSPDKASSQELNAAIGESIMSMYAGRRRLCARASAGKKRAYYLSAEFLVGRALYNNLMSLGLDGALKDEFKALGMEYSYLEEISDAGLGNGGLGRLAACFIDSAAALGLPLIGYGIRYKYGIFKQEIEDGFQREYPHDWSAWSDAWSIKNPDEAQLVEYDDMSVNAIPYDMPVFAYKCEYATYIRLWEAKSLMPFDFSFFNKQEYDKALKDKNDAENISRVLYPADDTDKGKLLRLRQEYFFSSATLKDVIAQYKKIHGNDFSLFASENIFQLNDTHPTLAIPEFLRLLCEVEGLDFDKAFEIAKEVFAYTNHTVMSEALEKWNVKLFKSILSRVYTYIELLDKKLEKQTSELDISEDEAKLMKIIDDDYISMANLALFVTKKVNGVAKLHTDILKKSIFKVHNSVYPGKIINITNGITQRRWLALANPELSDFTTRLLKSDKWKNELSLISALKNYANAPDVLSEFNNIKRYRRKVLADFIYKKEGRRLDCDSVFDIQIKRLHEYKRQLLNALAILGMYFDIKDGSLKDMPATSVIFGGKAAPGYRRAKGIIKLICEIEKLVLKDAEVSKILNVHFVSDYNVSYAEHLVAAADISEQISTAGTEASGTGNMKMMLNGAITLGTLDGANVEIVREAGEKNNLIFGATVEELDGIRDKYKPGEIYQKNKKLKRILDALKDGTLLDLGTGYFDELYDSLLNDDRYFVLYDFDSYYKAKINALKIFEDRNKSAEMGIYNMAGAGVFSSDRSIKNYNEKIWECDKVHVNLCENS